MSYLVCDTNFSSKHEYEQIFNEYPFELSNFQKWAIKGIIKNCNILITAHTGSGKTLPAEFAIRYFTKLNKKVIYCSPIKALSNEKFNCFQKKFPNISFGILTGDIKYNPEAEVLIMTTEILRNNLFKYKQESNKNQLDFEMDFDTELACIVYDEIHYINDNDRGSVWEEAIMMTPSTTQLIGLSATINKPENLCKFMASSNKLVTMLCPNKKRVVPLEHYAYFTAHNNVLRKFDTKTRDIFEKICDKPKLIKSTEEPQFNDSVYHKIKDLHDLLYKNNLQRINKHFVINNMVKYLKKNDLLPGLVFVFSRRGCYEYANKITIPLFEDNSKVPSIIKKECEQILISKLDNWREYTSLKEYGKIIKLLEKGIAVHHSGVTPVFREMIELLFSKGYIKLLFATETFAVGINMPTRTVVFTALTKFSNNGFRALFPHEYTQMAGRAGRRGIDTKGYVFHLNNLFINNNNIELSEYRDIMTGKSQIIKSKFNINYNIIISLLDSKQNMYEFIEDTLMGSEIYGEIKNSLEDINKLEDAKLTLDKEVRSSLLTDYDSAIEWYNIENNIVNLKRKTYKKKKDEVIKKYGSFKPIENDISLIKRLKQIEHEIKTSNSSFENASTFIKNNIDRYINILNEYEFIDNDNNITTMGLVAYNIQEIPYIGFVKFMFDEVTTFTRLSTTELICVLSIFTPIKISDEYKVYDVNNLTISQNCKMVINKLNKTINNFTISENKYGIYQNIQDIQYDICELVYKWCNCENEDECKKVFNELEYWGLFLGDFIKSLLKIVNIGLELEKCCEIMENLELLSNVKKIPDLLLKSVITNKSLYL